MTVAHRTFWNAIAGKGLVYIGRFQSEHSFSDSQWQTLTHCVCRPLWLLQSVSLAACFEHSWYGKPCQWFNLWSVSLLATWSCCLMGMLCQLADTLCIFACIFPFSWSTPTLCNTTTHSLRTATYTSSWSWLMEVSDVCCHFPVSAVLFHLCWSYT